MLGAGRVSGDEGQVDVGGGHAGELDLGLLGSLLQSLHRHLVAGQIHAGLGLEGLYHPVDDTLVKVVAAQTVVTRGSQNLLYAVADLDDGDVEGTAAEVVYHDLLVVFFIHAVAQRRRGRLVDDTLDVQTRDLARVLGRLTLCVGEVSGNGDNGGSDLLAQISLGVRLELLEHHRGDLLRGVSLAVDVYLVVRAHLSLDGRNGAVGVGDRLTLCDLTDQTLAVLGERDNGRSGARAFCICDNDGLAALDNCYTRVSCT